MKYVYSIEYILFTYKAKKSLYTNLTFHRNENRGRNCVQTSDTSSVVLRILLGHEVPVYDPPFVFIVAVSYHLFLHLFRLTGCQRNYQFSCDQLLQRSPHEARSVCYRQTTCVETDNFASIVM